MGDSPSPPPRPRTPQRMPTQDPNTLRTPRRSQDIRKAVEDAKGYLSPTARSVRRLLQKLEKVVDEDNLERARLKERIRYLEEEMRALKPVTRKRVPKPPKGQFASINDIAEAAQAARQPPKRRRGPAKANPAPDIEAAQEMIIHGLDRLHQIEEMN
jgi:hypothetical protein